MTTASDITTKLIQDRIDYLQKGIAEEEERTNNLRLALGRSERQLGRLVAERQALETDLASLTVADEAPDGQPAPIVFQGVGGPKARAPYESLVAVDQYETVGDGRFCSTCGERIYPSSSSPTGWRHSLSLTERTPRPHVEWPVPDGESAKPIPPGVPTDEAPRHHVPIVRNPQNTLPARSTCLVCLKAVRLSAGFWVHA